MSVFDWRRAGSWCGLAGGTIFMLTWVAAIYATPGYDFGGQWVSDLGVSEGSAFFNTGAILAGVLSIPFALSLLLVLRPSRLGGLGCIVMILAGIALAGVGIFTEDAGSAHTIVSLSFFSLMLLALVLLIWPLHKSYTLGPLAGDFTAAIVLMGVALFTLYGMSPLAETMAVLLIDIWSLAIAWKLRHYLCIIAPQIERRLLTF